MRVSLIAASTICGRITPPVMGSALDRQLLEKMRLQTAAGLIGAGTLRAEDPEMRGPGGEFPPGRLRVILSGSGVFPLEGKKIFRDGPPPLVFTGHQQVKTLQRRLDTRARVFGLPPGPAGLSIAVLGEQLAELGIGSLLIEGGARLNYAALQEGVVDDIFLTLTPFLSGDPESPSLVEGSGPLGHPFQKLQLVSCEPQVTGELFVHYTLTGGSR